MEQLLYFIVFIIYIVYSFYQSVQKENKSKEVVEDWEGQPEADEKSIEEILSKYLEPKKEVKPEPVVEQKPEPEPVSAKRADDKSLKESRRAFVQELREIPQANTYRDKERRKIRIDGEDQDSKGKTLSPTEELNQRLEKERKEGRELSPKEEFNQRLEQERKEQLAKGKELSAVEEYKILAAERARERDDFLSSVNLQREKVIIKDQKQLDDVNKIYGEKEVTEKRRFKFNAKDAIIYQVIMERKF
ncbi:MAG: hypothetical protein R3E32_13140 [Chitinophagales bacterium]